MPLTLNTNMALQLVNFMINRFKGSSIYYVIKVKGGGGGVGQNMTIDDSYKGGGG